MTILEFQKRCKKNTKTILNWLEKGYIPGVKQDSETGEWIIPSHARPPYTGTRAKTAQSIYVSIVEASNKRCHVFPELYHVDPSEFNHYIDELINAGLICSRTVEGVTYYDATLKTQEYMLTSKSKSNLRKLICECLESISKGATAATIEKLKQVS